MGFLISDGETFFHEEKRDLDSSFSYVHPGAPTPRQVNRDPEGRYTITKETIADPHASVVLMRVRLEAKPELLARLHIYALLSPHLGGGGGGNSARVVDVAGSRTLLAWKDDVSLAMSAGCGFSKASCGFVGASDGWQDLKHDFQMHWEYGSALDGNVAIMGKVNLQQATVIDENSREFVVAIGFGGSDHSALAAGQSSLATPFDDHLHRFIRQWERVQLPEGLVSHTGDEGRLLRTSQKVVLMHEDKTYAGAFIASLSIPWGYAKGDDDVGGYHPGLDPRHGAVGHGPACHGPRRNRDARSRIPRLHSEAGWRLRAELLGRRYALLDRDPARRGGLPHHSRLAAVEGRRPHQLRRLSLCLPRRRLPRPLCAHHPAGALGGDCRLLALDSRRGHQRVVLRG